MSELTKCNYCMLKSIRLGAKETDTIRLRKDTGQLGGMNVYVIAKGETFDEKKHFVAWLMSIPESCQC